MCIQIVLSPTEPLRHTKAADPAATDGQLRQRLGVTARHIKADSPYRNPGQKPGRQRVTRWTSLRA